MFCEKPEMRRTKIKKKYSSNKIRGVICHALLSMIYYHHLTMY